MNVQDKLIHRPEAVRLGPRTLFGLMTLAAWTLYLYLWLPLATLVLWVAGGRTLYLRLFREPPVIDPGILLELLVIAACCALLLIGWAEYNRMRFQGRERRGHPPGVDIAEMASRLGADPAMAGSLQAARVAVVFLDEAAVPQAVEVRKRHAPRD